MENEAEFIDLEEIEIISKSQQKRESEEIKKLGRRLTELTSDQLARIPLDQPVIDAIELAHKISNKRSALKRHFQFIGKLLRARDCDEIFTAVEKIDNSNNIAIQLHHQAEFWRDEMMSKGNEAINSFVDQFTGADRQNLRQLLRNHSGAKNDAKRTQHFRELYKSIKQTIDQSI